MKKVMLIYPSGEIYQRGEDRCQINVEASIANSIRACNDLGYIASGLKQLGFDVFLKDYPAENADNNVFDKDFDYYNPDVLFISTTNGSIYSDIEFIKNVKKRKQDIIIILKGALFFNIEEDFLNNLDLAYVDYLIGAESEFITPLLIETHFHDKHNVKQIQGISYKHDGNWYTNEITDFMDELDSLPFPDRCLMKNELYVNPLTNRPMATIITSKGCPYNCIYCLSPEISGKTVRYRSSESVFKEITECIEKFNIRDFFFKSDTFTLNKEMVVSLCDLIINSKYKGKINWVANSRVNTIDEELIKKMQAAGCSMVALGLESGSDESLAKMQKGTTVKQNIEAVELLKKYKMKIFGFYLIGFPWETKKHLDCTKKLIFKLDTDFIEVSIVTPFRGTRLYSMLEKDKTNAVLGKDSFKYVISTDKSISTEELVKYRKDLILKYHLRIKYILKKLSDEKLTLELLFNYIKYGIRLIKNHLS